MRHRLIASICFLVPLFYLCMGHMIGLPLPPILTGVENCMVFTLAQLMLVIPSCISMTTTLLTVSDPWHRSLNMDSLDRAGQHRRLPLFPLGRLYDRLGAGPR